MESKKISIKVSDSIGSVSAIIIEPKNMKFMMALAHGAGAGMQHQFMEALSKALAELGIGSIRFNFPFTENSKKRPDPPAIAEKTILAVWEKASTLYPTTHIFGAGKSFGGRMSSHVLSKTSPDYLKGVVFFGFPLHAPGQASTSRADHLKAVRVPMLFLQGTRDALADLQLITKVAKGLKLATIATFEGADHSFKAGKSIIIPDLADTTLKWMESLKLK